MKHLTAVSAFFLTLSTQLFSPAYAFASNTQINSPGTIVVSIKPLYSLVAHLTDGITQPVLLMKQKQSAHHYNMRPSQRRLLANAGMIIWIGSQMESSLTKVIKQQANGTAIVSALQAKDLNLLKKRNLHSHDHHDHDHRPATSSERQNMIDPHIWLSTHNAVAISKHVTALLIRYNPENTGQYNNNLKNLLDKIEQLKDFIKINLKVRNKPFIVHHDAFQYFEHENALNYIDTINFNEDTGASLKQLRKISRQIEKYKIQCLVYQAPRATIIDALVTQNAVKAVELDPLGMNAGDDKNAWFELMQRLTLDFNLCLSS